MPHLFAFLIPNRCLRWDRQQPLTAGDRWLGTLGGFDLGWVNRRLWTSHLYVQLSPLHNRIPRQPGSQPRSVP